MSILDIFWFLVKLTIALGLLGFCLFALMAFIALLGQPSLTTPDPEKERRVKALKELREEQERCKNMQVYCRDWTPSRYDKTESIEDEIRKLDARCTEKAGASI